MKQLGLILKYIVILLCIILLNSSVKYKYSNQKLTTSFCLPQVVNAKSKYYILSQGNSEFFRNSIHLTTNNLPDTSVQLFEFTPATAILKKISDVAVVRSYFGASYNNGKIYLAGGVNAKGKPTNSFWEFDITGKKWIIKPNLSNARSNLVLECFNNKIYAISGEPNASVEVFDIAQNKWQLVEIKGTGSLKILPRIVASTIIDDKIYLFGNEGTFQVISLTSNMVDNGPQVPFKLDYFDVVSYNRKIYVSAGATPESIDNTVYSYNTVENSWTKAGQINTTRCGSGIAYFGSMLLFIGGSSENISKQTLLLDDIFIYRPNN
jgi:hypothetical protein